MESRTLAGIAIAGVLCLWGAFEGYGVEKEQAADPYLVGAQSTRFAPLAGAVPRDAVMGYLSDAPAGSVSDSAMFNAALYVLAPRLLERGAGAERTWVLGNFTRPADFAALGRAQDLVLERDFGNGVVLFRRERRP